MFVNNFFDLFFVVVVNDLPSLKRLEYIITMVWFCQQLFLTFFDFFSFYRILFIPTYFLLLILCIIREIYPLNMLSLSIKSYYQLFDYINIYFTFFHIMYIFSLLHFIFYNPLLILLYKQNTICVLPAKF